MGHAGRCRWSHPYTRRRLRAAGATRATRATMLRRRGWPRRRRWPRAHAGARAREAGSVVAADRARAFGGERRSREPDEGDHHQEDDPEQVEDLVEADLRRLLADLLVE